MPIWYRPVSYTHLDVYKRQREIQYGSSLTVADIKATIISLSEKLAYYLKDGARVHIEGIGSVSYTHLKSVQLLKIKSDNKASPLKIFFNCFMMRNIIS